jgi:hypothetical protein
MFSEYFLKWTFQEVFTLPFPKTCRLIYSWQRPMIFMSFTLTVPSVLVDTTAKYLQQTTLLETENQIVGAFANCEKRLLASSGLSVCVSVRPSSGLSIPPPTWSNSSPTGRIFMEFVTWVFFRKSVENIQISVKFGNNNRHFICRPMYIYSNIRSVHLRMRNVSVTNSRQNQNTHFTRMYNNFEMKVVPFMRQRGKIWCSRTGHR